MNRRKLIRLASTAGALAAAGGYARYRWLPPGRSRVLAPVDELARRFVASLDDRTRARVCVAYDHPLRQYHNRGVGGGGLAINAGSFDWEQRGMLTDLFYAGLSEAGRERVPDEFFAQFTGVQWMHVLACGDPHDPPYQLILSGPHLNLRLGGTNREGVAFGGPQAYGDQRGDGRAGLPGNLYRFQLELGQELFRSLDVGRQRAALLEKAPVQTQIELQGRHGNFAGTPLAGCTEQSLALARALVDGILSTYPPADVAYAWQCLERNGGLAALFFSSYAEGDVAGNGASQIFRLEGPAAVFYFRGAPHVHAFLNVAMDGDAPLSVGEVLGENPAPLAGDGVKRLFERALRAQTGAELAYYDVGAVVGRLRAGTIRSGDIYTLESWQDPAVVAEIRGANLAPDLVAALRASGTPLDPAHVYSVATQAEPSAEKLGRIESSRRAELVRELTIAYLREQGFAALHGRSG